MVRVTGIVGSELNGGKVVPVIITAMRPISWSCSSAVFRHGLLGRRQQLRRLFASSVRRVSCGEGMGLAKDSTPSYVNRHSSAA